MTDTLAPARQAAVNLIHSTAIIDPSAEIADDVEIGPWSIIGPDVVISKGCKIGPHAVIKGPTRIGERNEIFQFASLGEQPQDKKYAGEYTTLEIGNNNVFREFVTINRGTTQDKGFTRIGNNNLFMNYVHIAHDCIIGNHTIFANSVSVAGHVEVGDYTIIGGHAGVRQFVKLGAHCFITMGSFVNKDIPPYILVAGNPASANGINSEGIRRRDFTSEDLSSLRRAYKVLYRSGLTLRQALVELRDMIPSCEAIRPLVEFLQQSELGIVR